MQTFNNNLTKKYDTILEGFKKACGDGNWGYILISENKSQRL